MVNIGSKGLVFANLTIPQGTSLAFDIVHKDENGEPIDHSGSTAHMAFQCKDRQTGETTTYDMDSCCSCGEDGISVSIPASATADLPMGKMPWDLIVETALGEKVRLCYGNVSVVDTYALDEDE